MSRDSANSSIPAWRKNGWRGIGETIREMLVVSRVAIWIYIIDMKENNRED